MSAEFSPDGVYRYTLVRAAHPPSDKITLVIMVNPSTADATLDDATIRKVRGFAKVNDWGNVFVGNLFAFRATDVNELRYAADPIGPNNDIFLDEMARVADQAVFAWGRLAKLPRPLRTRWKKVYDIVKANGHDPLCLGVGADGHPRHPLMLPYSTPVETWRLPRD